MTTFRGLDVKQRIKEFVYTLQEDWLFLFLCEHLLLGNLNAQNMFRVLGLSFLAVNTEKILLRLNR